MRFHFFIFAALCGLLASCSHTPTSGFTKADYANLRLRDLNPLAGSPPIVQAQQSTLREISAERQSFWERRFAWFRKPVDYTPPELPDGMIASDGGILPPKLAGHQSAINTGGYLPDPGLPGTGPEDDNANGFSIE